MTEYSWYYVRLSFVQWTEHMEAKIQLYDKNCSVLYESNDDYADEEISPLYPAQYIIKITDSYYNYSGIIVECGKLHISLPPIGNERFKILFNKHKSWINAARYCAEYYSTTLATIQSKEDLEIATSMLRNNEEFYCVAQKDYVVWINYDLINKNHSERVWKSINESMSYSQLDFNADYYFTLCNLTPNNVTDRNWTVCSNETECWQQIDCCNDINVKMDKLLRVGMEFDNVIYIGYWKSHMLIMDAEIIHITNFSLFQENVLHWNIIEYDVEMPDNYDEIIDSEAIANYYRGSMQVSQHRNMVYVLKWYEYQNNEILIAINLEDASIKSITMPTTLYDGIFSFVADDMCIYILAPPRAYVYNLSTRNWKFEYLTTVDPAHMTVNNYNKYPIPAAITIDHQYIYMFNYQEDLVIKFHIANITFDYLKTSHHCPLSGGDAVSAENGMIYLHGCHLSPGYTVIFDPITERFLNHTIRTNSERAMYSRNSHLNIVDDNLLSLSIMIDAQLFVFYAVTNPVSINFERTTCKIWPSEGFQVKYYANDFTITSLNRTYYAAFYLNETIKSVNVTLVLNTFADNCICDKMDYKCFNCNQYYDLKQNLSLLDTSQKLTFGISPMYSLANLDALIQPESITIYLQRCYVSFFNLGTNFTTTNEPIIQLKFSLSSNCYSRPGVNFSVNITASAVLMFKQLVISIKNNRTQESKICDRTSKYINNCININNTWFELKHSTYYLNDTDFDIVIENNQIDSRTTPANFSMRYIKKSILEQIEEIATDKIVILSTICSLLCVFSTAFVYLRYKYAKSLIVDQAIVLIIGISQFDETKWFLPGVQNCVNDLECLWREKYKYDVFICNNGILYTKKVDIIDFIDKHKETLNEIEYKSLIIHILSHGMNKGEAFYTSDKRKVYIDEIIHELTEFANNGEKLIKIVFNHICRGENIYDDGQLCRYSQYEEVVDDQRNNATKSRGTGHNHSSGGEDSNWAKIWGNIEGRTVSDVGYFTNCICYEFEKNNRKCWLKKETFKMLITNVRNNLMKETNGSHIAESRYTLREKNIILEKCNSKLREQQEPDTLDTTSELELSNFT
eukprot:115714_1